MHFCVLHIHYIIRSVTGGS